MFPLLSVDYCNKASLFQTTQSQGANSWLILKFHHLHEMTCLRKILATECDKGQPSQCEGDRDWGDLFLPEMCRRGCRGEKQH